MADTTDPTRDPTGATVDTSDSKSNTYTLTATLAADGSLQLSGPDMRDNVIEVPRGEDAVVKIDDPQGLFVFGVELDPRGERPGCWARNVDRGLTRRKFSAVSGEINSLVFATSSADGAKAKYGPIITVKPKG